MMRHLLLPSLALIIAGILKVAAPAHASEPQEGRAAEASEEFDLEDVFGFTEGTDTNDPGSLSLSFDTELRSGKAEGTFHSFPADLSASYGLVDGLEIGGSVLGNGYSIDGLADASDRSRFVFDGLDGRIKLGLLDRGKDGSLGLSLVTEGTWTRTDGDSGVFSDAVMGSALVLSDAAIVPDVLFAAVNFGLDVERDLDAEETSSSAFVSAAATARLTEKLAVGFDTRFESAFKGALDARTGSAFFAGPTFYAEIAENVELQGGWLIQADGTGGRFNTDDFERHRVILTVELGF